MKQKNYGVKLPYMAPESEIFPVSPEAVLCNSNAGISSNNIESFGEEQNTENWWN